MGEQGRNYSLELHTNWTTTRSIRGVTKSCRDCNKKAEFLEKKKNICQVSKHVLYELYKDLKTASTSSQRIPQLSCTRSLCFGQWETCGEQRSERATGNTSWLFSDPLPQAWTPLTYVEFEIGHYRAAKLLQAPMSVKLYQITKHARPNQVEGTWQLLEEFTKPCETFRTFSALLHRFRISLTPSDIAFNHKGPSI